MTNKSSLLSDRVGADLAEAIANLELLKKSLEVPEKSLQAEKSKLAADRQQLEDEKTQVRVSQAQLLNAAKTQLDAATASIVADEKSGLEDEKVKLQIKVSQLESDKSKLETRVSQLEAEQKQSRVEIQGLNEKVRDLERQPIGKINKMIPARQLGIEHSGTPQYWTWKSVPDSMYEVAELVNVCWLEIIGRLYTNDLTPNTTYAAYLVFKLTDNHKGFYNPPSKAYFRFDEAGVETDTRDVLLVGQGQGHHRQDGWMEVELGQCYVRGNDNDCLMIILREIEGGHWKSGLVVQGMEVRPK